MDDGRRLTIVQYVTCARPRKPPTRSLSVRTRRHGENRMSTRFCLREITTRNSEIEQFVRDARLVYEWTRRGGCDDPSGRFIQNHAVRWFCLIDLVAILVAIPRLRFTTTR